MKLSKREMTCNHTTLEDAHTTGFTISTSAAASNTIDLQHYRRDLPIFGLMDEIIEKIEENPVVIITGQTGCGKVGIDKIQKTFR